MHAPSHAAASVHSPPHPPPHPATRRAVVEALRAAAARGERVVLCSVVRVVGSSYGGVGARLVVRVDDAARDAVPNAVPKGVPDAAPLGAPEASIAASHATVHTVGLVSGGCLESDLAEHARRVHASGVAELVAYDTRADDDAVWGLGLGCNGLVEILVEPLDARTASVADLLARALDEDAPAVLATVIGGPADRANAHPTPRLGARALLVDPGPPADHGARGTHAGTPVTTGWTDDALEALLADQGALVAAARQAGRRGLVCAVGGATVALEVVPRPVRLLVCGSGPDAVPVARLGVHLGWDVTVVDHRPDWMARAAHFPGAHLAPCPAPDLLGGAVPLGARTAAVVMSHHFARDAAYLGALLASDVAYVGVLGPRARTDRLLAELATRGLAPAGAGARVHGPVGLDLGGEGPEAIALAIVSEVSAVMHGRGGGHRRAERMAGDVAAAVGAR